MAKYQIAYGHTMADCTPGTLTLAATNDDDAIRELCAFVADGYRNETWAALDLANGGGYTARNVRGNAVGQYIRCI